MIWFTWIGIALCLSQSAMLNGLNLALFTVNKLELRIEARKGNTDAARVLSLRKNGNFLLVTILWGVVAANVLLALLANSVLSGLLAFLFSTFVITILGEITPQAYFNRHALKFGALFAPVVRFYQILLFPIAKPTAMVLDRWLGQEAIAYFKERDIREFIKMHMASSETDVDRVEGQGALNFLELDDVLLKGEGEPIDPDSILRLPFGNGKPIFPKTKGDASDEFLRHIHRSGKKWIVLVNMEDEPEMVLDSDEFIRDSLFNQEQRNPYRHCHRPIIAQDGQTTIGDVISVLRVKPAHSQDDVVDHDVILLWDEEKRIITGGDILGRLLCGIVRNPVVDDPMTGNKMGAY